MRLRTLTILTTALFLLGSTGCREKSEVDRATEKGILIVGNSNEPKSLDPQVVTGVLESNLMRSLFEGMVSFHPSDDAAHVLTGAEALEHDESATVWTVRLRPEAVWSDGEPVTSEDYLFAYHRMLHPQFGARYAEMLYFLRNAAPYNRDQRGRILFEISPMEGIAWEEVEDVNYRGDEELDAKEIEGLGWEELDADGRILNARSRGLNVLGKKALEWIAEDPEERYVWPEEFEHAQAVVDRLLAHHGEDLWDLADVGIRVIDEFTFELTLRGPTPYFPQVAKHYTWMPVPRHIVLRHGGMLEKGNPWSKKENIVTNGPFQLKSWRLNAHIEVERNPRYWNADNVTLNGVRFLPISNPYTEARMFRDEQLHITYTTPPEVVDLFKKIRPEVLRQEPYVGTMFYRCNTTREPLDNPLVRRALALAIDRKTICDKILKGYTPAWGMTPPMAGYEIAQRDIHDPARAKELLAEAGYPNGEGFPKRLKVLLASRETAATVAQAVQAMWRDTLGIQVEIENKEWTAYLSAMQELEYDIAAAGWIGDYLDPLTFLEMWTAGNGNNLTGWSNEEYEALLEESFDEPDPEARYNILRKAENILMDESPTLLLAWYSRNYLIHPSVKGWNPLLLDNHPYDKIRLEPVGSGSN